MTGYEIIRRNIEFDYPERVGLRFSSLGISDIYRIYVQVPRYFRSGSHTEVSMEKKPRTLPDHLDEWGCLWSKADGSLNTGDMGQVIEHPIKELDQLDDFTFPDPTAPGRFDGLEQALEKAKDLYVQLNSPHCLFERMLFLRGFEPLLMDLYINPEGVKRLADRLIEYQIGIVREAYRLGKGRIHCFDTTDDWGTQQGLIISPPMWRKIFKPYYRKLVDAVHRAGMHIRFHTDGKVNDILEDFIELGIDIINIHQPRLLGIEEIGEKFAGRVCFEVSVDIQCTLPLGDKKTIQNEVKKLIQHWATSKGGLIGIEYRYLDAIGADTDSLMWELEAFQQFGKLT